MIARKHRKSAKRQNHCNHCCNESFTRLYVHNTYLLASSLWCNCLMTTFDQKMPEKFHAWHRKLYAEAEERGRVGEGETRRGATGRVSAEELRAAEKAHQIDVTRRVFLCISAPPLRFALSPTLPLSWFVPSASSLLYRCFNQFNSLIRCLAVARGLLDQFDCVESINHFPKDRVLPIQVTRGPKHYEERCFC